MKDVSTILDTIGDDDAVCAALSQKGYILKSHVPRDWRRRNSIPSGFWAALAQVGDDITLEALALFHKKPAEATQSETAA